MNDITRHEPSSFLCQRCNRPDAEISGLMISHPEGRWVRYEDCAALLAATQWRPIETAPKDETEMLLAFKTCKDMPAVRGVGYFATFSDCWRLQDGSRLEGQQRPTHWMPLPKPPTA